MKSILKGCVVVLFVVTYLDVNAQTTRQIDAARLKEIIYPPLTDREEKNLTLPIPPAEHPRLFFRKSDIPDIKMKTNHPLLKKAWGEINERVNIPTDGRLKQGVAHNFNWLIIEAIEAKAFIYALTGNRKIGDEAIDLIFNLNNTLIIDLKKQDVGREIGRVVLTTAMVYDWCYDLIAPNEKKSLIAIMESLAVDMGARWSLIVQGSINGHGVEAQLARDILSCGVATYDERPEIYNRAAGRIFAEFIPAQNFVYLSGYHHQGSLYGSYET